MNDFQKFAISQGISSNTLYGYQKHTNGLVSPTIIEERQLNAVTMDVFSRLMGDRIIFLGTAINDDVAIDRYKKRIARLTSGVAIINVGGNSDAEVREKMDRIDDALRSTKAATEEGIVPGGGTTLAKIASILKKMNLDDLSADVRAGYNIVLNALTAPITQIANNAGVKGDVVAYLVGTNTDFTYGYDALEDRYVNMYEEGIVDPAKVIRSALENAANISASLLTTEVAIVPKKEQQPSAFALQMPNQFGM